MMSANKTVMFIQSSHTDACLIAASLAGERKVTGVTRDLIGQLSGFAVKFGSLLAGA
jgi:hypothetical protein